MPSKYLIAAVVVVVAVIAVVAILWIGGGEGQRTTIWDNSGNLEVEHVIVSEAVDEWRLVNLNNPFPEIVFRHHGELYRGSQKFVFVGVYPVIWDNETNELWWIKSYKFKISYIEDNDNFLSQIHEVNVPAPNIEVREGFLGEENGQPQWGPAVHVEIENYGSGTTPYYPQLPYKGFTYEIPYSTSNVTVSLEEFGSEFLGYYENILICFPPSPS